MNQTEYKNLLESAKELIGNNSGETAEKIMIGTDEELRKIVALQFHTILELTDAVSELSGAVVKARCPACRAKFAAKKTGNC